MPDDDDDLFYFIQNLPQPFRWYVRQIVNTAFVWKRLKRKFWYWIRFRKAFDDIPF